MLLVVDMQEKYMKYYPPQLISRVNRRIEEAVNENEPIVYVMNIGNEENRDNYVLANDLEICSNKIFEKNKPSAFSSKKFREYLSIISDKEIEMIGVDGNCCVKKTAVDAAKYGYTVIVNKSCVGVRSTKIFEKTMKEFSEINIVVSGIE